MAFLRKQRLYFLILCTALGGTANHARAAESLGATLDVYVFPANGQPTEQQSRDEAECYEWAVTNSGLDPFETEKVAVQQAEQAEAAKGQAAQAGRGSGLRGAARGAAAGALIGEIADDDAGKGAAYGAAAGAVAGRRRGRTAQEQAIEQAEASETQAQQVSAQELEGFRKAFSVCLEAKEYMVKY